MKNIYEMSRDEVQDTLDKMSLNELIGFKSHLNDVAYYRNRISEIEDYRASDELE